MHQMLYLDRHEVEQADGSNISHILREYLPTSWEGRSAFTSRVLIIYVFVIQAKN